MADVFERMYETMFPEKNDDGEQNMPSEDIAKISDAIVERVAERVLAKLSDEQDKPDEPDEPDEPEDIGNEGGDE